MKPLILVKHSLPEVVEAVPAREWILSEAGRKRIHSLGELLRPYQPEVITSSVEPKAQETAFILAEILGLDVNTVENLHEHDRTLSPYYSREEFQRFVREFFEHPNKVVFGNETATQCLVRFREAIKSILKDYADKIVIVVSHGTVISLFVSWLTKCDGYALWQRLGLPSFVVLDMQSQNLLKTENLP